MGICFLSLALSPVVFGEICGENVATDPAAILAICDPVSSGKLCDNNMPVTWPIQITSGEGQNRAEISNLPATVKVSYSPDGLIWSSVEDIALNDNGAVQLFVIGQSLAVRVVFATWCSNKKTDSSFCTLY